MILESIFKKVNFVDRYKNICEKHNDFDNGLRGSNKKMYLEKLKAIDNSVVYFSKDKMFKISFGYDDFSIDIGLQLNDGLVEARLFYVKKEEWLLYNRFDFICEKIDSGFDRKIYNLPKYTSEEELEIILKETLAIYEDIKNELTLSDK